MRTTEELVADFKAATFDKLRATICAQIWKQAPTYEREKVVRSHPNYVGPQYRGQYVSEILASGGVEPPPTSYWVNEAMTFLATGADADAFWEQTTDAVKYPMALNTALGLYRDAVKRGKDRGVPFLVAAVEVLEEYNARPVVVRLPSGRFIRKTGTGRQPSAKAAVKVVAAKPMKQAAPRTAYDGTHWQALRNAAVALAEHKLKDTEPAVREQLWRRFENDLRVLFDEFASALKNATENERKTRSVTLATMHKHAVQACATLMIDPPKRGHPVDLRKANRQKKMLARQYHPDASGTDETRGPYEAVLAAFEVCKQYNAQVSVERPELVVHQGGKS